jgi:HAD superfamily hydrolase (TIGR01509 family)
VHVAKAGLFLDLDGTLAKSLGVMRASYDAFLGRLHRRGSDQEFERLNGPRLAEIVEYLATVHELPSPQAELLAIYNGLIAKAYDDVVPDAAANDLLNTARRLGLATGVITSNSRELTIAWLRRVGLIGSIDIVVGGDDVKRGKHNAEPYLLALQRTGCDPTVSFAVEDSQSGARAAIAAGIQTFLLSNETDSGLGTPICREAICVDGLTKVVGFIVERHAGIESTNERR